MLLCWLLSHNLVTGSSPGDRKLLGSWLVVQPSTLQGLRTRCIGGAALIPGERLVTLLKAGLRADVRAEMQTRQLEQ